LIKTADPRISEDIHSAVDLLTTQFNQAVSVKRATTFNSAELFVSVHDRELYLSNGVTHRFAQTRIYAEAAYSFTRIRGNGERVSDEYLNTQWAVNLDDLPVAKLFSETSERAEHSLDTEKPETGKYPVIVDAEVLATLFNDQITQLSAANAYNGLPFITQGAELIPNAQGDLLSITLDPELEYGANSGALSEQGLLQTAFKLVEKNQVTGTSTDKQYADYLGIPANTSKGNVVVDAGAFSHQELTKQAPQVIEILQFSGLFADPNSGTFSSEIRLAKLYDNRSGRVTYLKGGSLSGSIKENFKGIRLSKNRVKRAHFSSGAMSGSGYYGPEFALLSDVSIVG
jgi:predicted Zn-dependent protease